MIPGATAAIAGGGIIGLSIAWRLAQQGWRVHVFDQGEMGGEASWAGAGMLAPGGEIEDSSDLAALATASRALYPDFVRQLAASSSSAIDYQECGAIDLAYSAEEWQTLEARALGQATAGIGSKSLTVEEVRIALPCLNTDHLMGAKLYPGDGIVNPRDVVHALVIACRQLNVTLHANCAVEHVAIDDQRALVQTACGAAPYDAAVIACGAWSGNIPLSGVPPLPASEPVKGHLIGYRDHGPTCRVIVRHRQTYLLERANGLLLAGASTEHVGFDRSVDQEQISRLRARACFLFRHLHGLEPAETWTGLRPGSDQLHLGSWHSAQLFLAYGHYRNGILLAPATARKIAREMNAALR